MNEVGLIFILGFLVFMAFILLDAEKKKNKQRLREISDNPDDYIEQVKQGKKDREEEIAYCISQISKWKSVLDGTNKEWKKVSKTEKYIPIFSLKKKNRKVNGWEKKLPKKYVIDGENKIFRTRRQIEWEIKCENERIKKLYSNEDYK